MIMLLFFSLFLLMFLLPFLPGIRELVQPQDSSPLHINMNYSKDPRYFGKSFRSILDKRLATVDLQSDMQTVKLSKKEAVLFSANLTVPEDSRINYVLYVTDNFVSRERCIFEKEIYTGGKATVGDECEIRALAADARVSLGNKTNVIRWVDSEEDITTGDECDLGWSISCQKKLRIGSGSKFRRLFGMPVLTCKQDGDGYLPGHYTDIQDIGDTAFKTDSEWLIVPPSTKLNKVIIATQNLLIKYGCILKGDIKTYGNLIVEEGVRITGNVFAEKDVAIAAGTRILGNIFSQGTITIASQTKIGRSGMIKSAVSRKEIVLGRGVSIFGYVLAGKKGRAS